MPEVLTPRKIRGYGFKRGLPDVRDKPFRPRVAKPALPVSVSLREKMCPVWDQGDEGSCTAHGLLAAFAFARAAAGHDFLMFSRNFLYYMERLIEGTTKSDAGAEIRDGAKALNKTGVCLEATWPYTMADMLKAPSAAAKAEGLRYTATSYLAVAVTRAAVQGCLAEGFPVVIGFTVYASFEGDAVAASGVVPMPKRGEAVLGGHCVLLVGYGTAAFYRKKYAANAALVAALKGQKDDAVFYETRNSWSAQWANGGYCLLPAGIVESTKYGSDYWTIRVASA